MELLNLFIVLCFCSTTIALNLNPEEKIGAYLKSTLRNLTHDEIIKQMELHFLTMKLLVTAQPRNWAHPKFAQHEADLIPLDIDKAHLEELIDQIIENVKTNPYLHEFLVKFKGPGMDRLLLHVEQDGHWGLNDIL